MVRSGGIANLQDCGGISRSSILMKKQKKKEKKASSGNGKVEELRGLERQRQKAEREARSVTSALSLRHSSTSSTLPPLFFSFSTTLTLPSSSLVLRQSTELPYSHLSWTTPSSQLSTLPLRPRRPYGNTSLARTATNWRRSKKKQLRGPMENLHAIRNGRPRNYALWMYLQSCDAWCRRKSPRGSTRSLVNYRL